MIKTSLGTFAEFAQKAAEMREVFRKRLLGLIEDAYLPEKKPEFDFASAPSQALYRSLVQMLDVSEKEDQLIRDPVLLIFP